ncbi:MAG: hypothetical protein WCT14_17815, partial [Treponemataceae bacterium]
NIYAATAGGISISTNSGTSWTNYTTTQGLGSNTVNGVYGNGTVVFAATNSGLSVSTNGGSSYTNSLAGTVINSVFFDGTKVYAATIGNYLYVGQ